MQIWKSKQEHQIEKKKKWVQVLQEQGLVVLTIAYQVHQSYLYQGRHRHHDLLISLYRFSSPFLFLYHHCP